MQAKSASIVANTLTESRDHWPDFRTCAKFVHSIDATESLAVGRLAAGLVLLALLVAALLGPGRQNMTNYRSAVGAQQPSTLVLDGISISYTDSGGSGLVVICLHAIGMAPGILRI